MVGGRALASQQSTQVHWNHTDPFNSALFVQQLWISEHISVSGNPSPKVISSQKLVIYSKCLNELKSFPSLKLLVLADGCSASYFFKSIFSMVSRLNDVSHLSPIYLEMKKIINLNRKQHSTVPLYNFYFLAQQYYPSCGANYGCSFLFHMQFLTLSASILLFAMLLNWKQNHSQSKLLQWHFSTGQNSPFS